MSTTPDGRILMRIPIPNLLDLEDELERHAIDVPRSVANMGIIIYCRCGQRLLSEKAWSRHASEKVASYLARRAGDQQ